jgi:hypothetical protein
MIPCGPKHAGIPTVILWYKYMWKEEVGWVLWIPSKLDYTASSPGRLIFIANLLYFPSTFLEGCFVALLLFSLSSVTDGRQHQLRGLKTVPSPLIVRMRRCRRLPVKALALLATAGTLLCGWATAVTHSLTRASHEPQQFPKMNASSVCDIVETGVRPVM